MFEKFKTKVKENIAKVALGATTTGALLLNTVIAHAEDPVAGTDISGITGQITTSLSDSKIQFVTSLGAVVVVAVGYFIVKFVVKEVIIFFAKVASKG